jgi:cadmium resistance protein CadD (predicted permease)
MNRPASLVVAIFLFIIAIAQLCRVVFGVGVIVAGYEIPIWPSAIAAIVLISLAIWLLKEKGGDGK